MSFTKLCSVSGKLIARGSTFKVRFTVKANTAEDAVGEVKDLATTLGGKIAVESINLLKSTTLPSHKRFGTIAGHPNICIEENTLVMQHNEDYLPQAA